MERMARLIQWITPANWNALETETHSNRGCFQEDSSASVEGLPSLGVASGTQGLAWMFRSGQLRPENMQGSSKWCL